ncbi:hypothetical protein C8Q74DRAFT_539444 [Fomes fomentarius]|nr:hypothetical protein C8Q74DRAFT_539444 [Fomes fomentarius]
MSKARLIFAQRPFNNPAGRDVILRSRDGVHFCVRSDILLEASPLFSDVIQQQRGSENSNSSTIDGKPIVPVAEDSHLLDPLLRLAYPIADPVFASLKDLQLVLAATIKYRMEEAASLLRENLRSYIKDQPLRVWAIACLLRLDDEAKSAADALLGKEIPVEAARELQEVTAGDVYRLAKYHLMNGSVAESFRFWEPDPAEVTKVSTEPSNLPQVPTWLSSSSQYQPVAYRTRPYGDIICRSSDGTDFVSHRIILTMASPALAESIARLSAESNRPAAGTPPHDTIPVFEMDAPATTLSIVLELCYGTRLPTIFDNLGGPGRLLDMMVCARQYQLEQPLETLSRFFNWSANDRPLLRYLMASKLGFNSCATRSLSFLRGDLIAHGYVPEMETTPGTIYHALLINRRQSAAAASKVVNHVVAPLLAVKPEVLAEPASSQAPSITSKKPEPTGLQPQSARSSPTTTPAKTKPSTSRAIQGSPWLVELFRQTAEALRDLTSGLPLWRFRPDIPELLKESLVKKIWCHRCEPNVRLLLEMGAMHQQVSDAVRKHDQLKS